ncbi:hypothetical protein IEQ34_016346 [Dendrobium chrysotoxum]|uniref:Uncharacterized protein n=1 Tax=Dendrobium chrysotoxum TaxID=161865 RepID=A0AAV7GE23_DENCH|nr:hypothetical protein IEQ34_016346 [Dendrobium chrysotoxum]
MVHDREVAGDREVWNPSPGTVCNRDDAMSEAAASLDAPSKAMFELNAKVDQGSDVAPPELDGFLEHVRPRAATCMLAIPFLIRLP